MVSHRLRTGLGIFLFLSACAVEDAPRQAKPTPTVEEGPITLASVAHRDDRLGVPSFVWFNRDPAGAESVSISLHEVAKSALPSITKAFAVMPDAAKEILLAHVEDDHAKKKGTIIARYEQRIGGVEVFRGGVSLLMTREGAKVAASGFLAPTTQGADRAFVLGAESALQVGAKLIGVSSTLSSLDHVDGYDRFSSPSLYAPARVKRVLFPLRKDASLELEPAYFVEIMLKSGAAHGYVVSALDGRVLLDNNLVHYDAFNYRVYADPTTKLPTDGPQGNAMAPHPTGTPDHQKLVFEPSKVVTLESFPFSKNDPWLPANATTTNGNNVLAYADIVEPDGYQPGKDIESTATAALTFGNVFDTATAPSVSTNAQAATTNLFYITNFLHDWYYDAGYDEKAGNTQIDNFKRGGMGGDPLHAEAQDYSGRNNANAAVLSDGTSPRIQMYLFSGASNASLVVANGPAAGTKTVGIASGFGKDVFDTAGTLVLAADSAGDQADACEPLENDVANKIVLIHRGTCSFAQKAANAQAAGALGAIIANVASSVSPTVAPFMGGTQDGITIPVLSVNAADGAGLEASLVAATTVTMKRAVSNDLDGALDTSIVVHEWGHVLSNRLINDAMGLTTNQSGGLGEGWGDFTALLLTVRADDPGNFGGAYANGSFATSGSGDDIYYGVRRLPYSIDFTKNALTLKHISNGVPLPTGVATSYGEDGSFNSEVHSTGEIWASLLWECYASLLRDSGLPFNEAQERMKRYYVASLKLTPPDPTIIEARDAVLAAALASDEKDFQLFWKAFAKRGAGAGAVAPPKDSTTNQGVVESYEFGNNLQIVETKLADDVISCDHDGILDEGEVGTIEVTIRNTGSGALNATKAELVAKTKDVKLLDAEAISLPPLKPFETTKTKLKARLVAPKPGVPIELDVNVTDPALPEAKRTVHVTLPTRYDADEAAESAATDHVDTVRTAWKASVESTSPFPGEKWGRPLAGSDGYWQLLDPAGAADHKLTSPPFTIADTTFTLQFKHKWQMKRSIRRNVDIDGGLIEVSVDAGKTWKDISEYGAIDYNTTIDTGGRGDNPLKGRKAYGNTSPGYPDQWVTSKIDVTLPEHPEDVRIRYRVGSATGRGGADGWLVDDIELTGGVTSTPFYSFVPHADACDPNGPTTTVGPSQTVKAKAHVQLTGTATHPTDKPLTIVWTQTAGPAVTLKDGATLNPSFDAFDTGQKETVSFALRAHDGALISPAARVDIIVEPIDTKADEGCTCSSTASSSSRSSLGFGVALVGLAALVRRRRRARS